MKLLTKPVWSEGMYLGPHHFQAQLRYFEDSLNFVTSSLWRDAYGFVGLRIDADALRNGTLALTDARGLFEDGLAFDIPDSDTAPPTREFTALFPSLADSLTMHLAVPAALHEGGNTDIGDSATGTVRYRSFQRELPDDNTGRDEKQIRVGRKNLTLLSDGEVTDRFVTLPLVRIVRDGAGRFAADASFVPPCLSLQASDALMSMLHRLLDILGEKSGVLSYGREQRNGTFQAGMSARHVAQYWFLHALNSNAATLRHLLLSKHAHPEELFREMARLAGALCTFGLKVHPRSLPVYDHRAPGPGFAALDEHIRRHLTIVDPAPPIDIPLRRTDGTFYIGEVADERCLGASRWILEIGAGIGEADLIERVPRLVKVCSARFIPKLVEKALPGLVLKHLPVPPSEMATRVECQYFIVNASGPCWDHILQTRQVGIHVSDQIPAPSLKLMVLLNE